ncbi:hypothetical protein IRJ41_009704 [Triplophysa rosa]|uniref:DUF4806 domain-containing protein n=1 Tax=Triplophysa rosa TaxID=992332 RepID=A0A9W7WZI0_TRIRA|nr:hypothetical protein IRJ41_009704 [Triplophysa rosa]
MKLFDESQNAFQEDSEPSQAEETDEDEEQPQQKKSKRTTVMLPEAPYFPSLSTTQVQPHQSVSANQQNQGSMINPQSLRNVPSQPHQSVSANQQNQGSVINPQSFQDEVLEEPCKTVEELEELCDKLKDADFRKKIVHFLCLQGGGSLGDGIRRMLKKIGANSLWGRYSYKGRKGKLKFQQLIINDAIIHAVMTNFPKGTEFDIVNAIGEHFKEAPGRAGGGYISKPKK